MQTTAEAKRVRAALTFSSTQDKWTRKNGIAYSAIVERCEGHNGAMLAVMQRKAVVRALLKKFRVHHTVLLQMKLANFNSLKMAPNETGSDFINRILATQYGYLDLQEERQRLDSNPKLSTLN